VAVLLGLLALVTACGSSSSSSSASEGGGSGSSDTAVPSGDVKPYTLKIGYVGVSEPSGAEGYYGSLGKLQEDLAPYGVEKIEWVRFPAGPPAAQALTSGAVDIQFSGDVSTIVARANGGEVVVALDQNYDGLDPWLVAKKGGPTSLAELEGKSVAVAAGSFLDRFLEIVLKDAGLYDKVTIVNMDPNQSQTAVESGSVDAAVILAPQAPTLQADGHPVLAQASKDAPRAVATTLTSANKKFLDAHPEFPAAWEKARTNAARYIQENAEAYSDYMVDVVYKGAYSAEAVAQYLSPDLYTLVPWSDAGTKLLEEEKTWLLDNGWIKTDFDISEWQWQY